MAVWEKMVRGKVGWTSHARRDVRRISRMGGKFVVCFGKEGGGRKVYFLRYPPVETVGDAWIFAAVTGVSGECVREDGAI